MNVKSAGWFLIVLTALCLPLQADDREIAHSYFIRARELERRGDADAARSLLEEAVAFLPTYSDNLFLLGKILCARQETTASGISLLEQARRQRTWVETPPDEAAAALARACLNTRRFKEAYRLYDDLKADRVLDPALEIERARAAFGAGDERTALAGFEAAVKTFPEERAAYLAYIQHLSRRGLSARALVLVERGRKEFPDEPRFLYYKIALTKETKLKETLLDDYLARGGKNPGAALFYLDADDATFGRALDFFFNQGGDRSVLLLEALATGLARQKARREAAAKKAGVLSGEKTVDADEDGFSEELYTFKENNLTQVRYDRNQDGRAEVEIDFEKNAPVIITLQRGLESHQFAYNIYPRLHRVRIEGENRNVEYQLIPDALTFSPVKALSSPAEFKLRVRLPEVVASPTEKTIALAAYSLVEEPAGPKAPRLKWELFSGRKLVLHEDADRNGSYEHTVIYNDRGEPLRGLIDADGDGFYETLEMYVKGVLSRITYDANRDGVPDYAENADQSGKAWDLDGDGKPDVVPRRSADGKILGWDYTGYLKRKR